MIPLADLAPQLSRREQRVAPTSDMQTTVDRITAERIDQRKHDSLLHTLIFSVWRR